MLKDINKYKKNLNKYKYKYKYKYKCIIKDHR